MATHRTNPISWIEDIPVTGFETPESLFEAIVDEVRAPGQSVIQPLNVHSANISSINPTLKKTFQSASLVYCDGAGIVLAARLLGQPLSNRLTAADWFIDMMRYFAERQCKVYLLGGEPGVPEATLKILEEKIPNHTVIGVHHGFILKAPEQEQRVINEINRLQPDIVIVGFGTLLQELWIEEHKHKLNVSAFLPLGATMDFVTGKVRRCPVWMGKAGLEWLFRLMIEPGRMMGRYVLGNPWFLGRILGQVAMIRGRALVQGMLGRRAVAVES